MKIATLEYIHSLLEEDVAANKIRYQEARDKASIYKKTAGCSRTRVKELEDYAEGVYDIYIKAVTALNDFEDQDF